MNYILFLEFRLKKLRTRKIEINVQIKQLNAELQEKIKLDILSENEYQYVLKEIKSLKKQKKIINKQIQAILQEIMSVI